MTDIRLTEVPPADWDEGLPFPTLSTAFAHACRTMGQRPLYATDGIGRALVLTRCLPVPLLRRWTTRAKVYVDAAHPDFTKMLVRALRARGVSYAKFGDAVWGLPQTAGSCEGMGATVTHLMTFDVSLPDTDLLARMEPKTRAHIRKSEREGVVVEEVGDEAGVERFCDLSDETSERMRARDITSAVPRGFFHSVFRDMVPRKEAMFLLATADGQPLAGGLFLMSRDRMSYYLGASTRDRAVTWKHGPSALFWLAMRYARDHAIGAFDLGAVTPSDDPVHPNHSVYQFKRGFGGRVVELRGGAIPLSPLKCRFQDRVVLPVWKKLYPLYLSATATLA